MASELPTRHRAAALWEAPTTSRARRPLDREAIVATALHLADTEGLDAVSFRRIAETLSARTMSLYRHVTDKDELLDLMFEQVSGEVILPRLPRGDWRKRITAIARRTLGVARDHPWMAELTPRRRVLGPNALAHVEQSLAALDGLDVAAADKVEIMHAVDTFSIGHFSRQPRGGNTRVVDDVDYVSDRITPATYPHLAATGPAAFVDETQDAVYERGLAWLLDGIAADLER